MIRLFYKDILPKGCGWLLFLSCINGGMQW